MITIGVDVGQASDPTAVIAIESDLPSKMHTVRWIESVPLGTPYTAVVDRLVEVDERCRAEGDTAMVVDYTGVGRPVLDMLRSRLRGGLHGVTISGGAAATSNGPHETVLPKRDLTTALEVVMQSRRLIVVKGLQGSRDLRHELKHFTFAINARGRDTYEASAGSGDDLVIALCLAVWLAERWIGRGGRRPGSRLRFYGSGR